MRVGTGAAAGARSGFTLIELLIVVVVIGLLTALAVPKYQETKRVAHVAEMKAALRKTALDMELRFADRGSYSSCAPGIVCAVVAPDIDVREGVSVTVTSANATGWQGRALHGSAPGAECLAGSGTLVPAGLEEGVPGGKNCK